MKFEGLDVNVSDVQRVQLEILIEFDRICKKHDIHYHLFAGTLLGCVRHKGFIPWDDDIDICLLRDDYNKFISICETELDSKYFMQTYETDPNSYKQSGKLRKNDTTFLQSGYRGVDMHHGISISLMPLDNVLPHTIIGECQRILFQVMFYTLVKIDGSRSWKRCRLTENRLERLARYVLFVLSKAIPKRLTEFLHTKVACMFNDRETKYVTHLTNGAQTNVFRLYDGEGEFYGYNSR